MGLPQEKETKYQEFGFHDEHFNYIRKLLFDNAGITLSDVKRDMVYSRLVRRLRSLQLPNFEAYCKILKNDSDSEMVEFTNALTTNLTSFFRENHHFNYLKTTILPLLQQKKSNRRIRIWSAGCSTGEEPYSVAISIHEAVKNLSGWDIKILATDLDSNVVATARAGVYLDERIRGVEAARVKRWFNKGSGEQAGKVRVVPELKELITFKQLNLMHPWPMKGLFDLIFCRNVVIYFNKDTQRQLFDRYADYLDKDAHLIVGHSESLHGVTDRFRLLGKTIYQKIR